MTRMAIFGPLLTLLLLLAVPGLARRGNICIEDGGEHNASDANSRG